MTLQALKRFASFHPVAYVPKLAAFLTEWIEAYHHPVMVGVFRSLPAARREHTKSSPHCPSEVVQMAAHKRTSEPPIDTIQ
jgi:hypothetical protein